MKVGLMIFNAMFILLFISVVIGEWGKAGATIAGLAILSILINSIFILLRTKSDLS